MTWLLFGLIVDCAIRTIRHAAVPALIAACLITAIVWLNHLAPNEDGWEQPGDFDWEW